MIASVPCRLCPSYSVAPVLYYIYRLYYLFIFYFYLSASTIIYASYYAFSFGTRTDAACLLLSRLSPPFILLELFTRCLAPHPPHRKETQRSQINSRRHKHNPLTARLVFKQDQKWSRQRRLQTEVSQHAAPSFAGVSARSNQLTRQHGG